MNREELKQFIENNKENYSIQLKRCYPLIYDNINKSYSFDKFGQKLYHHLNGDNIGKCEICGKQCQFDGIHKGYRKRCSYQCMGKSKYEKSHETRKCVICGNEFEIYKYREKTTCSNNCLLKLNFNPTTNKKRAETLKKTMIKNYGVDHASKMHGFGDKVKRTKLLNHGDENYVNPEQCKLTKSRLYGDSSYNNIKQTEETCMKRYGVSNVFHLKKNKTNGKQISKFQRREYEKIIKENPDAELEKYLPDVKKSVDIYIPSKKKIIECFGDYWHCNPSMYMPDFYHTYVHMNASEIWNRDNERIKAFQNAGYNVEVIWENTNKQFKH